MNDEIPPGWWRRFHTAVAALLALIAGAVAWAVWAWRSGNPHQVVVPAVIALAASVQLIVSLRSISNPDRHYWWERWMFRRPRPDFPVPDLPTPAWWRRRRRR